LLTDVIATLSSRGQIVIPQPVRDRCRLGAGDHFAVDDDPDRQTVTLRKVQAPGKWFEVYMQCPHSFELPPRRKEFYRSKHGLAD
jgi:AbrB family looped-hinge helix DNA binding protein